MGFEIINTGLVELTPMMKDFQERTGEQMSLALSGEASGAEDQARFDHLLAGISASIKQFLEPLLFERFDGICCGQPPMPTWFMPLGGCFTVSLGDKADPLTDRALHGLSSDMTPRPEPDYLGITRSVARL